MQEFMPTGERFKVGFSADFLDEERRQVFPDIGLSLLDSETNISYEFMEKYCAEYLPEQLADYDVLISLKPRITADSLRGVDRRCAVGRKEKAIGTTDAYLTELDHKT
jgi:hypothetical protein